MVRCLGFSGTFSGGMFIWWRLFFVNFETHILRWMTRFAVTGLSFRYIISLGEHSSAHICCFVYLNFGLKESLRWCWFLSQNLLSSNLAACQNKWRWKSRGQDTEFLMKNGPCFCWFSPWGSACIRRPRTHTGRSRHCPPGNRSCTSSCTAPVPECMWPMLQTRNQNHGWTDQIMGMGSSYFSKKIRVMHKGM